MVQAEAVAAMAAHPTGVLVAPPGTGKTVMARVLIAHHALPTAVIVNRAESLAQRRERLITFLDLATPQSAPAVRAGTAESAWSI